MAEGRGEKREQEQHVRQDVHAPAVTSSVITARHQTQDRSLPATGQPEVFQMNAHPRAVMEEDCPGRKPSTSGPESGHSFSPSGSTGPHPKALPVTLTLLSCLSQDLYPPRPGHPQRLPPEPSLPPALGIFPCTRFSARLSRKGPEDVNAGGAAQV